MPRASSPYLIKIPRHNWNAQAADARSTLQTWQWRYDAARTAGAVELDFADVQFMEPWALAMFACFARALQHEGVRVSVALDSANPANVYFEQAGLREIVDGTRLCKSTPDAAPDTGLCVICTVRDAELFAERSADLIRSVDEAAADRVRYCVTEFGRNVAQHAQSPAGAVAIAQRFPQLEAVQIVVCDAGRGVLGSLQPYYPELRTHLEGLRLAVLPHTSGAAPPGPYGSVENMGLGLFFTKEIAWRTGGSFWLVSGDGLLGMMPNGGLGPTRIYRKIEPWRGAMVAVHLPDRAPSDFQEVLAVCHELALQVQRDPAIAGLEFIDAQAELPTDAEVLKVDRVQHDLGAAHELRSHLDAALDRGALTVLEFSGVRFLSTSIAQALLFDALRRPGSLTKLFFRNCTRATTLAIRTVAAFARATYPLRPH